MEIQFVLNDKQVKAEVGADTILLNVLRDLGCKSVSAAARRQTVDCVQSGSTENPAFPARFLPQVSRERALRLWKALKKRLRSSENFWQMKERSSAVSVLRDLL